MSNLNKNHSRSLRWTFLGLCSIGCAAMSLSLAGCRGEVEEEPVVQQTYTPPPPVDTAPKVTSVRDLMEELRIDDRIYMADSDAPATDEERRAVLEFFDAFARGDSRTLGRMLTSIDRRELEALVESGQWHQTTGDITSIEIQTGPASGSMLGGSGEDMAELLAMLNASDRQLKANLQSGKLRDMLTEFMGERELQALDMALEMSDDEQLRQILDPMRQAVASMESSSSDVAYAVGDEQCALALFEVNGEFQVALWYYSSTGNGFRFEAAPTPPNMVNRLSGTNWIAAWHDIIAQELVMANQPDEQIAPPQRRVDDQEQNAPPTPGGAPTGPAGPRQPTGPPPPQITTPDGPQHL